MGKILQKKSIYQNFHFISPCETALRKLHIASRITSKRTLHIKVTSVFIIDFERHMNFEKDI